MKRPLIVIGGGGHARVLLDTLLDHSYKIIGITDPNRYGLFYAGIPVIGNDDLIKPCVIIIRNQKYSHFHNLNNRIYDL